MMDCMVGKTPVSLLHEMCTRKNVTPKYDLLQVEGAVHEPIFQYRLTLEYNGSPYEETGTGRSKKEAKHNTARAMLRAMNVTAKDVYGANKYSGRNFLVDELHLGGDNDMGGNPVGILQELCMKMKQPPPNYDVDSEEGLPHERLFAIACKVGEHHIQIGRGKSKKLAKRMAAHLMAEHLRSLPVESAAHYICREDDEEISRILSQSYRQMMIEEDENDEEDCGATSPSSKPVKMSVYERVDSIYTRYWDWNGAKADLLHDLSFKPNNPIEFLQELGVEQSFKVMIIDIDEKSATNVCQCLIQLSLDDPTVFCGEGDRMEEAKNNAALEGVKYFQNMISAGKVLRVSNNTNNISKLTVHEKL